MLLRPSICLFLISAGCWAQTTTTGVGQGAPSGEITVQFQSAYYRNGFAQKVSGPTSVVARFGSTGLVQECADITNTSGTRYALVKPDTSNEPPATDLFSVWQVYPGIYAQYKANVTTYGYPHMDTATCFGSGDTTCSYQLFDKNYGVFYYTTYSVNGQTFVLRDPYYTRWYLNDGLRRMGAVTTAETSVTSGVSSAAATVQAFTYGAVYNITSGTNSGRQNAVRNPIYQLYAQYGTHTGFLGYPLSEELTLSDGRLRQTFEGGAIEYDPNVGAPSLRAGVKTVSIGASTTAVRLNVGETKTLTVSVTGTDNQLITDRKVNWVTTNGRVVTVTGSGQTGTITAVGAGSASVSAVVDGVSSASQPVVVTSVCCAVGEGASTASIRQAFQDAITRNKLNLRLPADDPAQRVGNGWVQSFVSASGTESYMVAVSDKGAVAWVITGKTLARYVSLGGPAGTLAYPSSDATSGGRQMFENGALAGSPVRVVAGTVLTKWAALGYETGKAGSPSADAAAYSSFLATTGTAQSFDGGVIYSVASGSQAGKSFFVAGAILTKYLSLSGPGGKLGAPVGDDYQLSGRTHQEFEGGYMDYSAGAAEPVVTFRDRKPAVDVQPATVLAGETVRVAVSGFADGERLRVSLTGQPDFLVSTTQGSYAWSIYVPSSAASGTVTVKAASATNANTSATGTYTIRSLSEAKPVLSKLEGDNQVGIPGGTLPRPMRVSVSDSSGRALMGVPVIFEVSPGAKVLTSSTVTDNTGQAWVRLSAPVAEGIVLCTARVSGGTPVTFSARAAATTLSPFPRLMQNGDALIGTGSGTVAGQGALLASAASILRYHQDRRDLPTTLGQADPVLLNQYLSAYCGVDSAGVQYCDGYLQSSKDAPYRIANLWRLASFAGGQLEVITDPATTASISDAIGQSEPALLALNLTMDKAPAGAHFVVAVGVDSDGNVLIHDPSPLFTRYNLAEYLNGFQLDGHSYQATLTGVIRMMARTPSATGFVLSAANARAAASSVNGTCGNAFDFPAWAAVPGQAAPSTTDSYRMIYCAGTDPVYQIDSDATGAYRMVFTDLGASGGRSDLFASSQGAFRAARSGGVWAVTVQEASFTADGVVNGATFVPGIAPGGAAAIFGSGLSRQGLKTTAEVAGKAATVLAATPFQVNIQVPADTPAGPQTLTLKSPFGTVQRTVDIAAVAPGIFIVGSSQAAITNQNNSLNTPIVPAARGQAIIIYCTGLGAVRAQGTLQAAQAAVTVNIGGRDLTPFFAGFTPGYPSLYQVNVTIPADMPPGIGLPLVIRQNGIASNTVTVSVQ